MKNVKPVTLAVDIGGTGLKMLCLDAEGNPITERLRVLTPIPATPDKILLALDSLKAQMPAFDRVSLGFPGVVKHGMTMIAVNLDPKWVGYPLAANLQKRWKKPVRVANDAVVQGLGAIQGRDIELILTLGTGLGSCLFVDGHICPMELGHHPWKKMTYEDYLGRRGLKKYGKTKWNKLLEKAIVQTKATFNWDHLYLGGGNTKLIQMKPRPNITIVSNMDGLLGGVALWRDVDRKCEV
ncbi:MAG TPA: ROK family protein [Acidobacteriaceae bacterium]|jgi:polyphosphate glucokinase|nr:ROK family protein [Acidobacteriaceae bacterium]